VSIDLDPDAQSALLHQAVEVVLGHARHVRDLPIAPADDPAALRASLHAFDLEHGADPASVVSLTAGLLESCTVLTTHPRYFGLFNPSPLTAGIAADILTAGFNPQLAVRSHAPGAVEIEALVIRTMGEWTGLPSPAGSFTTGGAEANATAVALALQARFPEVATGGLRALPGRPVFYASSESHLAWLKIAHQCGLGRDSVRLVPADASLRLDLDDLRGQIARDRAAGECPFLVVATAGTTSAGVVDPLPEAADLAEEHGLWFHVDAAWAGAAVLSDVLRPHLAGIDRADSVTVDAHKWLSVPMGAGMLLTRHGGLLHDVFDVATSYMPATSTGANVATDPYTTTMQWSRRAAGLKLFLALAVHGRRGYARQLEHDVALADDLREALRQDGWHVANDTPLPVVCISEPEHDETFHRAVAESVIASGVAWVSFVLLAGRPAVRACVISHRSTADDVAALAAELRRARADRSP
jgi:glutamate/tyrosine decarboxylase-like PLP-dependent enzyme